jgi:carboxymethylenebutenolidase
MTDRMQAETISIAGNGGDEIAAYFARPLDEEPRGGIVVIHHMPGYDPATKEITRAFAANGYAAVMPNLFHRFAPGADHADAAAAARAAGGTPDAQAIGDVGGGVEFLRSQPFSNGKVGVIGYCSGGRQTYLSACQLPIDAAVDCYGGGVIMSPEQLSPERPVSPIDLTADMRCPLLGLFGKEDRNPAPEHVAQMEAELTKYGKEFEFHSYDGAGHAFFSVDRPAYNVDAAVDGWKRIWAFYAKHLQGA